MSSVCQPGDVPGAWAGEGWGVGRQPGLLDSLGESDGTHGGMHAPGAPATGTSRGTVRDRCALNHFSCVRNQLHVGRGWYTQCVGRSRYTVRVGREWYRPPHP